MMQLIKIDRAGECQSCLFQLLRDWGVPTTLTHLKMRGREMADNTVKTFG